MHISSVSLGQPGEYVGKYRGLNNYFLCPQRRENSRHCFKLKIIGLGKMQKCIIINGKNIHRKISREGG